LTYGGGRGPAFSGENCSLQRFSRWISLPSMRGPVRGQRATEPVGWWWLLAPRLVEGRALGDGGSSSAFRFCRAPGRGAQGVAICAQPVAGVWRSSRLRDLGVLKSAACSEAAVGLTVPQPGFSVQG
jgi:hypothetical protein